MKRAFKVMSLKKIEQLLLSVAENCVRAKSAPLKKVYSNKVFNYFNAEIVVWRCSQKFQLWALNFIKKETLAAVFSYKFCQIFSQHAFCRIPTNRSQWLFRWLRLPSNNIRGVFRTQWNMELFCNF